MLVFLRVGQREGCGHKVVAHWYPLRVQFWRSLGLEAWWPLRVQFWRSLGLEAWWPLRVQFWRSLDLEAWPPGAQKGRDVRMEEIDLGYLCKTFSYEGLGGNF